MRRRRLTPLLVLALAMVGVGAPAWAQETDAAPAPGSEQSNTVTAVPGSEPTLGPESSGGGVGLVVGRIIGAAISTPTRWEFTAGNSGPLRELSTTIVVYVTTTDRVTIGADDADGTGAARGRIQTRSGLLGWPLVASADGQRQSLSEPVRPPLAEFGDAITSSPVRIELTQRVRKAQRIKDLRQKHVMVTIAPPVP